MDILMENVKNKTNKHEAELIVWLKEIAKRSREDGKIVKQLLKRLKKDFPEIYK